jgi:hypothetical protein
MNSPFFITGNLFCGECGTFLTPEIHRTSSDGMDGRVTLRGHKKHCSLYQKAVMVRLPQVQILEVVPEISKTA